MPNGYSWILKELLTGLSLPASIMLTHLVLDPTISLNPYFAAILAGGVASFGTSLGLFLEKKQTWYKGIWHFASIGLAGFVLVYWGRYDSFLTGIKMEVLIIVAIASTLLWRREVLAAWYEKSRIAVYLMLILCALFPVTAIGFHVAETPVVTVSPSPKFVVLPRAGMGQNINVSVVCSHACAWDIRLTVSSSDLLAVYLDSRERGPIEIPYLEPNRGLPLVLRVDTSPRIPTGIHNVALSYQYKDAFGRAYAGTANVEIIVGEVMIPRYEPTSGILTVLLTGAIVCVTLALWARRAARARASSDLSSRPFCDMR